MSKHNFRIGERVFLSYPYVGPNSHLGQVVRFTPCSLLIQLDGNERSFRFFLRKGQWRNEFGRAVSVDIAKQPQSVVR